MRPVQANDISKAVQAILKADVRMQGATTIERSPLLNEDPSRCPWIGIYRDNSEFTVRTLGYGPGARRQKTTLVLVVQATDNDNGENAEDQLEAHVANALDSIFSNPTLNGLVSTIDLSKTQYRLVQVQDDDFFQQAEIYLTFETTTR